jgi:hypothetical protein
MHKHKEKMCVACGYVTNASDMPTGASRPPREGDFVICFNCGLLSVMGKDEPKPMTKEEFELLDEDEKLEIAVAIALIHDPDKPDLAKEQGGGKV